MKKILLLLLILSLSVSSQTFRKINKQYGFNFDKFETPLRSFKYLTLSGYDRSHQDLKVYSKESDFTKIYGYDVYNVRYIFSNDSLIGVRFITYDIFLFVKICDVLRSQKPDFKLEKGDELATAVRTFENVTVIITYPLETKAENYSVLILSNKMKLKLSKNR